MAAGEAASIGRVYYIALSEWGLTPQWINENWTEELLALMFVKRKEMFDELRPKEEMPQPEYVPMGPAIRRSNKSFFKRHNLNIKKV